MMFTEYWKPGTVKAKQKEKKTPEGSLTTSPTIIVGKKSIMR